MKLQINTKSGLYELIAQDKELEIEIKKTILNDLVKNYLKAIVNTQVLKDLKEEIMDELSMNGYYVIKQAIHWNKFLTDDVKKLIKQEVATAVQDEISEQVHDVSKELNKEAKERINSALDVVHLDEIIKHCVNLRLTEIINKLADK